MSRNSTTMPPEAWEEIIKGGRAARPSRLKRSRGFKIARGALVALVAIMLIYLLIAGYAQLKFNANRTDIGGLTDRIPQDPMNVLVLGSDSREGLSEQEKESFGTVPGRRADTIVLLHLDEKRQKVVLVHFPRDLRVGYPDGRTGKINGLYAEGPEAMIQTVSRVSGLPISHYVEVNFNGFNKIVESLGGVDVYFEEAISDADSGLEVPKGCVTIEGDQALAFVRVRKIDDDFGRIARQQLFIRLMMDKIISPGTLLNPPRVIHLVNLFTANVTYDANLSVGDIRDIALRLRGFDSSNVDMRVIPSAGARIDGVSYVVANEQQTDDLFEAIKERRNLPEVGRTTALPVDPVDVRLTVLNGTDVDQLARDEANALSAEGFVVVGVGDATQHPSSTVYYRPDSIDRAQFVAQRYGVNLAEMPDDLIRDDTAPERNLPSESDEEGVLGKTTDIQTDIALVLGEDFAREKENPAPTGPGAAAPAAPPPPVARECSA